MKVFRNEAEIIRIILFSGIIILSGILASSIQAYDCVVDTNGSSLGGQNTADAFSNESAYRLACGKNASASGSDSSALGRDSLASGALTTALGRTARAQATHGTALGAQARVFLGANDSVAVGRNAQTQKGNAVAIGSSAITQNIDSIAIGRLSFTDLSSPDAIAIGDNAKVKSAPGGIAIGAGAYALASNSIAIGKDVVTSSPNKMVTNVSILAIDPNQFPAPRTMFEISGFGNTKFTVINRDANESWGFANPGTGFRLSRQNSGQIEFEVKNNGNAVLAGTLTENSDVNAKQDIQALDQQAILAKVMDLDISQWRYKDDPDSKHIGPMAQDFYQAFELGNTDKGISTLDSSGVALAAIQALHSKSEKTLEVKDAEIRELTNQISELKLLVNELLERS